MKKFDIVYTWVDGSDLAWIDKKEKCLNPDKFNDHFEKFSTVNGRFRNSDEIIYSLRSIEQFYPEHGKVFVITDNQKHPLLNEEFVTYVDHKEIMNELPTFSSKKIESNIFNIQGLSDDVLYFNDDVFLGPQFSVNNFVKEDKIFIQYENTASFEKVAIPELIENSFVHLRKKYQDNEIFYSKVFQHNPKILNKSLYNKFKNEFIDVYDRLQTEMFRDVSNPSFVSDMYFRWLMLNGLASEKDCDYLYILNTNKTEDFADLKKDFSRLSHFCINDGTDNVMSIDEPIELIKKILDGFFPNPSKYEIASVDKKNKIKI